MASKKVVFLFGGPGTEHEVSCWTAESALPNFEDEFILKPVFITKDSKWVVAPEFVPANQAWPLAKTLIDQKGVPAEIALDEIENDQPYVLFLGLHGAFGEDGTLQTLLDDRQLSYTGSDAEASALAMDKPKVLQLLQDEDIAVPEFLEVTPSMPASEMEDFIKFNHLPVVILPADNGSSFGVSIVRKAEDLAPAIAKVRKIADRAVISHYIPGRELTIGLLAIGQNELVALPITEIKPHAGHDFWDFDAKYKAGESTDITPADLPEEKTQEIQKLAKRVHQLVGADGCSRVDIILAEDGQPYVLEINTLPGMTAMSIVPQQAKAFGLTFGQLLTTLCTNVHRSAPEE